MVRLEGKYIPKDEIRSHEPYFEYGATLIETLGKPESVCDLGCANGQLLAYLDIYNINLLGLEYFQWQKDAAQVEIKDKIIVHDLRKPYENDRRYDVVNCTEVGEHIDAEYAQVLIDNIKRLSRKWIITTWSKDGDDPHGQHLNPLPYKDYIKLFQDNGFRKNDVMTAKFLNASHKYKNFYFWWRDSLVIWTL